MTARYKSILEGVVLRQILNFNITFLAFREYYFRVLLYILIFKKHLS